MRKRRKKVEWKITSKGCFEVTSHSKVRKYPVIRDMFMDRLEYMNRYYYKELFGEIPEGLVVRHKCDNPACVNPEHLELGTHQDNTNDKIKRGRFRQGNVYGSKNNFAKLTEEQVLEIRKTHIKGVGSRKGNTKELANKYGVSITLINQISRKDIWKHLEER